MTLGPVDIVRLRGCRRTGLGKHLRHGLPHDAQPHQPFLRGRELPGQLFDPPAQILHQGTSRGFPLLRFLDQRAHRRLQGPAATLGDADPPAQTARTVPAEELYP